MRRLALLFMVVMLAGCGAGKHLPQPTVIVKDSVIIRDRYVHDTVQVEIPKIVEKNVTKDTTSHLENDYATSDAMVSDGLLYHSLETRPQKIYIPMEVPVHDTTYIHCETITETMEVERELTKWQQRWIKAGKLSTALLLLLVSAGAIVFYVKRR